MSSDSKTIIRMVKCDTCKGCTKQNLLRIGSQPKYEVISATCSVCSNTANIFFSLTDWNSIQDETVYIHFN